MIRPVCPKGPFWAEIGTGKAQWSLLYMHLVSASSDGDQEVTEVQFKTPFEALEQHLQGEIWLAPPQFFEFARLATYPSISSLRSFSEKRLLKQHMTIKHELSSESTFESMEEFIGKEI